MMVAVPGSYDQFGGRVSVASTVSAFANPLVLVAVKLHANGALAYAVDPFGVDFVSTTLGNCMVTFFVEVIGPYVLAPAGSPPMLSHEVRVAVLAITCPTDSSEDASGTTWKVTVSVWLTFSGPGIVQVTSVPLKPTAPAAGPPSNTLPGT